MPHSDFDELIYDPAARTVTAKGTLKDMDDTDRVFIYGSITQGVNGTPCSVDGATQGPIRGPSSSDVPWSITVHLGEDDTFLGDQKVFATAALVAISTARIVETYTWAEWVDFSAPGTTA